MSEPTIGLGHNAPPSDVEILREQLAAESALLIERRDDLLGALGRAPDIVADEETAGKVADLVKLVTACIKSAEGQRVARKEPFLAQGRAVDGFYKQITDPLDKARRDLDRCLTTYQRAKAEIERRRREEEARRQAEEAARVAREAAAAAEAMRTQADLDRALTAAAEAQQANADAEMARRVAEAPAAELSRSRGELGAVASLRTVWKGEVLDRQKLDLETLRPFIPSDCLEKALAGFVRSGARELRGANIFQHSTTQVR